MSKAFFREARNLKVTCLLAAVLLNGIFVFSQIDNIPYADEPEYVEAARAISNSGRPYYNLWGGWKYTVWHPPLYEYICALAIQLFNPDWVAIRMAQYIFFGGALILLFSLFGNNKFYEPSEMAGEQRVWTPIVVLFLTLINPYVIQSVLLIDIDNNVLFFFITLFLFFFVLKVGESDARHCFLLGLLFCFALWAKMTTTLALPMLVFLYYLVNAGFKKALFFVAKFLSIGVALFLLSYSFFVLLTGVPYSQPFEHTFMTVWRNINTHSVSFFTRISPIVKDGVLIIIWLTPATFMLFIIGIYDRINEIIKKRKLGFIDIFATFGVIVLIAYVLVGAAPFGFPKYQGMIIPFILIPASPLIVSFIKKLLRNTARKDTWFYIAVLLLVLLYSCIVVKDPLYSLYVDVFSQNLLQRSLIIALFVLPLPAVLILLRIKNSEMKIKELLTLSALLVAVPTSISMDFYQSKANYSTRYFYGEGGMKNVVKFVNSKCSYKKLIFARKDIGWASGVKWIQTDDYLAESNKSKLKEFEELVHSLNPSIIVVSYRRSNIRSQMHLSKINDEILSPSGYVLVKKIGDFEIYGIKEMVK